MGGTLKSGIAAAVVAAVLTLPGWTASAETRAVVVGVSGYPNLPAALRLSGPKNDARAVAEALVVRGVASPNVSVLADGAEGLPPGVSNQGPATRERILAALDGLAEASGPGDLAVFFFSGHGAQQPDLDGDEGGGHDEIFLPYDTGSWTGGGVEGALLDDELQARVKRILESGADFWGVIDACHSATGFRDVAGFDARARRVPPEALGIPAGASESRGGAGARLDQGRARGRAAFFYAAQEVEEALETTPPGAKEGESFGVFTFNLLRRLKSDPGLSYRRLHQAVVNDIKRGTMMATQTPELEGTLLDAPVLADAGREMVAGTARQWPFFNGTVQAGLLDGLGEGAVLALYADPAAPAGGEAAFGVVEAAGAAKSQVRPEPCPDGGSCAREADPAAYKKARWARLVSPGLGAPLVLSEPFRANPADGRDYAAPLAALKTALAEGERTGRVRVSNAGYDVAVALADGTLAFAPAPGLLDREGPGTSPRLTLPGDPRAAARAVSEALDRIARVSLLGRLGSGEAAAAGLEADLFLRRAVSAGADACPEADEAYGAPEPAGGAFHDCDILGISLSNGGRKPLDVSVLLIKPDFSVETVWPAGGEANRLHVGDTRKAEILQMEPNPVAGGEERLVVLAVPGVNRAHTVFDGLSQEGLRATGLDGDLAVEIRPFRVAKGARR